MKHEYFEWNGVKSTSYGIYVSEQPPIMIPVERVEYKDVAGKSGSVAITEGERVYKDLTMPVKCWAKQDADLSIITRWIRGQGRITFANRPEGYYKGRLSSQAELSRFERTDVREFTLSFRCEPHLYLKANEEIHMDAPGQVRNLYNEEALPVIQVIATGDFELTVNGELCRFTGITDGVTINSMIQEAYHNEMNMNGLMEGDFPILLPGDNEITWTENVTGIIITPNWRKT